MSKPFLLDFDSDQQAVIEPDHERDENHYQFQPKLLFAFLTQKAIDNFLVQYAHKVIGVFKCFDKSTPVYEVEMPNGKISLCQAMLGAPAATELLDWLISFGVRQVLAIGSAGTLVDLPENYFLVPTKAIRDEGTSFHYMEPGNFVDLHSDFLTKTEKLMNQNNFKVKEVMTWTTDGFFRETVKKVSHFKNLGASCVEMECAAMAACAQFRKADFAQILFTADSLSDIQNHVVRGWGRDAHELALELTAKIIEKL